MKVLQTASIAHCLELPAKTPELAQSHVDIGDQTDVRQNQILII